MVPVVSWAEAAPQVTARSSIISPSLRMPDPFVRCSLSPAQFVLHVLLQTSYCSLMPKSCRTPFVLSRDEDDLAERAWLHHRFVRAGGFGQRQLAPADRLERAVLAA